MLWAIDYAKGIIVFVEDFLREEISKMWLLKVQSVMSELRIKQFGIWMRRKWKKHVSGKYIPEEIQMYTVDVEPGYFFLLPCSVCGRNFQPESLPRHQSVCEKNAQKKRPIFDSSKQRLQGTDIPKATPSSSSPPSVSRRSYSSLSPAKKRQSKWKEQHNDLIRSVRAAKGIQVSGETTPVIGPTFRKRATNVFQALPDDCTPCPYCERSFGGKSFDRHVEWCKDQRTRLPSSPTDQATVAKERLEARIKYRAPAPKRSLRDVTREKYSPTRNINPVSSFSSYIRSVGSIYSSQSGYQTESNRSHGGSQSSLNSKLSAAVSNGATSFSRASVGDSEASSVRSGQTQRPKPKSPAVSVGRSPSTNISNFTRNTGSRYSLRSLPSQKKEVKNESPITKSPFNSGSLRASLRVKKTPASQQHPIKPTPSQTKPILGTQTIGRNFGSKIKTLASPLLARRNAPATTARPSVLDLLSPGKRAEPDGIESMMTASCIQLDAYKKESNVQVVPVIRDDKPKSNKDAYDPYLSAQKQMEDLLDSVSNFAHVPKAKSSFPIEESEEIIEPKQTDSSIVVSSSSDPVERTRESPEKEVVNPAVSPQSTSGSRPFQTLPRKLVGGEDKENMELKSAGAPYATIQRAPRSTFASLFRTDSSDRMHKERKDSTDSDVTSPKRSTSIPRPVYSRSNSTLQDADTMTGVRSPPASRKYFRSRSQAATDRLSPNGGASDTTIVSVFQKSTDAPRPIFPRTAAVFRQETPPQPPPRKSLQTSAQKREQAATGLRLDDHSRQRVAALEADLKQILSGINELGLLSQHSFEPAQVEPSETKSPSKFCHCCGTPYPVAAAKFCCSCGEKRLYC